LIGFCHIHTEAKVLGPVSLFEAYPDYIELIRFLAKLSR